MSNPSDPISDAASNQFAGDEDAALQGRLSAAGASWRRDVDARLAQASAFTLRLRQQIEGERARQTNANRADSTAHPSPRAAISMISPAPPNALPNTQRANARKGLRSLSTPTDTTPSVTPTPPRRRFAGSIAAAMALLIVAALAVVLARGGLTSRQGNQTHHSATANPTQPVGPTATPVRVYYGGPFVQVAIAPSNPQVVYAVNAAGNAITRSSDGGASYSALPLPHTTTMPYPQFFVVVSPLNANQVIATATGLCQQGNSQQNGNTQLAEAFSGGASCGQSFSSADGGQTWSLLSLPFPGVIASPVTWHISTSVLNLTTDTLQAQGSRLYAADGPSDSNALFTGSERLIVSSDGGASWQSASNGLGVNVCDFAPAPTGAAVYAITAPAGCSVHNGSLSPLDLWRSDNAGASWTQVSALPTPNNLGMFVTANGDLYINLPKSTDVTPYIATSPDALIVSHDGGQSFTRSPLAGAPAAASFSGPAGELSDGSILTVSYDTTGEGSMTFYAWRAGQLAWHKVSQTYTRYITDVVVASANGTDVVYLADVHGQIVHFTI